MSLTTNDSEEENLTETKPSLREVARQGPTTSKKRKKKPNFNIEDNRSTGHTLVDQIGCFRLQGFIHDRNWLFHEDLQSESSTRGKTNLAHSIIWAFLVDRYRPIKKLDPETGTAYYEKKFVTSMLTTTYSRLARLLGFSESQVRKAIAHFRKKGLIGWEEAPEARAADKNEKPFRVWPIPSKVREVTGRGTVSSVKLADHLSTGNWVCDEMAQIKIQGNVIDYNWLGHPYFLNERGITNPLLLLVYADVFFLHTPTYPIDPETHAELKPRKKFDGDVLYKGYLSWSRETGLTENQLRDTVVLIKIALADVEFGPILDRRGELTNNKVLIALKIEAALEVTYGTAKAVAPRKKVVSKKPETGQENEIIGEESGLQKTGGRSPESRHQAPEAGGRSPESRHQAPEAGGRSPESGDIHSGNPYSVPSSVSEVNQHPQSLSAEMSVDDVSSSNSVLAPSAHTPEFETPQQSVRAKLLDFAGVRNIEATSDEIDALLQKWPAANLADEELVGALIADYEIYSLDKPADENIARAAVKAAAERLRWFLCAWPGFEESTDAYHEKTKNKWTKTSCFFKKWKTAQPPATWLEDELALLRGAAAREAVAARERDARAFWETLNKKQRDALEEDVLTTLNQSGGERFVRSSDEFVAKRREMLLDPETREWLEDMAKDAPRASARSFDESDETEDEFEDDDEFDAPRSVQMSIEIYVGPILEQIREKTLTLKELKIARPALLDDGEWNRVKDEVVRRAYEEKLVA